jgi:hypothetical protein
MKRPITSTLPTYGRSGRVSARSARTLLFTVFAAMIISACSNMPQKTFAAYCDQGLCLVHLEPVTDSDADGFSDDDEKSQGTNPYDASSHPGMKDVVTHLAARDLKSFNRGLSEIVALPDKDPKGSTLLSSGTVGARQNLLKGLGLDTDRLASYGMSDALGFVIAINKPGAMQPPAHGNSVGAPGVNILALRMGLYASGATTKVETSSNDKCDTSGCFKIDTTTAIVTYTDDKGKVVDTVKHEVTTKTQDGTSTVTHATCSGAADCKPKRCAENESCNDDTVFNQPKVVPVSRETTRAIEAKLGQRTRPAQQPDPIDDGGPVVSVHRDPLDPTIILTDPEQAGANVKIPPIMVISIPPGKKDPTQQNTNFGGTGGGTLLDSIILGSGVCGRPPC